jgi:hypothetical protein
MAASAKASQRCDRGDKLARAIRSSGEGHLLFRTRTSVHAKRLPTDRSNLGLTAHQQHRPLPTTHRSCNPLQQISYALFCVGGGGGEGTNQFTVNRDTQQVVRCNRRNETNDDRRRNNPRGERLQAYTQQRASRRQGRYTTHTLPTNTKTNTVQAPTPAPLPHQNKGRLHRHRPFRRAILRTTPRHVALQRNQQTKRNQGRAVGKRHQVWHCLYKSRIGP